MEGEEGPEGGSGFGREGANTNIVGKQKKRGWRRHVGSRGRVKVSSLAATMEKNRRASRSSASQSKQSCIETWQALHLYPWGSYCLKFSHSV